MINFLLGLAVGGVAILFVRKNNKKKVDKLTDQVDNLYEELTNKKPRT